MKSIFTILFATLLLTSFAQTLTLSPDVADQGQNLSVLFSGSGLNFSQGSNVNNVYLAQGSATIFPVSTFGNNANNMICSFQIPSNASPGYYSAIIFSQSSNALQFSNAFYINHPAGIETVAQDPFSIYPNPVSTMLNISNESSNILEVTAYDMSGNIVATKKVNGYSTQVNTTAMQPGIYLLRIKTTDGEVTRRFAVTR
jgi:hypothetical protein